MRQAAGAGGCLLCSWLCFVLLGGQAWAAQDTGEAVDIAADSASEESAPNVADTPAETSVQLVKSLDQTDPPQVQSILGPSHDYAGCHACGPLRDCECRYWDYRLDMGIATGRATFGDNEWQGYRLEEKLHTPRGNEYTFWQSWLNDHSFINSHEWAVGAKQKLPDFWNDGELRASQEYRDYRDLDFAFEHRKQTDIKLNVDPSWDDDETRAWIEYRFRNVEYPDLQSESYALHDVRLDLQQVLDCETTASGGVRYANYNYGLGGTRSSRLWESNARLDYKPGESTSYYAQARHADKRFSSRPDRNYDEKSAGGGFRWNPDEVSTLSGDVARTEYIRPFNPGLSYSEWQAQGRYWRQVSQEVDMDLSYRWRNQEYGADPLAGLKYNGMSALFNYAPDCNWRFNGGLQHDDYAFTDALRASANTVYTLGSGYQNGERRYGLNWRRMAARYGGSPAFDYDKDDVDFDYADGDGRWRWRSYIGFGHLEQVFAGNPNNYDERRLGFEWGYELDCHTDLTMRLDHNRRNYANQTPIEDTRLEADVALKW
jgi:hypothetical protein